jgi:hypothetical protein
MGVLVVVNITSCSCNLPMSLLIPCFFNLTMVSLLDIMNKNANILHCRFRKKIVKTRMKVELFVLRGLGYEVLMML